MKSTIDALERSEPSLLADYATLLKLRIASFVGFSAYVGGSLAAGSETSNARLLEASLWITLAAGAASVFNQVLERDTDRLMDRTKNRPLPAGRISSRDAIFFGAILAIVSIGALAVRFNALSALLALATLFSYVAIYTPLKRTSSLNTLVGALPGAAPPLLGYVAIAGRAEGWAWALFAVVFVWQFPHFMAIAWLHRHDYARAGLRMLPAIEGAEGIAGRTALVYSLVLIPVSTMPLARGDAGPIYTIGALVFGAMYAVFALRFALKQDRSRARALLFASLVHLPSLLLAVLLDPRAHAAALHGL